MLKSFLAFAALVAIVPVAAIAVEFSKLLYADWRNGVIAGKTTLITIVGSLWIVLAYTSTYALFVFFGGEA